MGKDGRRAWWTRFLPDVLWGIGYLVLYMLLDWISYVEPYGNLDITPWNPPPGLSLAFLLLKGMRFSPLLYPAALLSDVVVRGFQAPLGPTLLADAVVAGGYTLAAWVLTSVFRVRANLSSLKDVLTLLGVQIPTAMLVAAGYVGIYHWAGLIPLDDVDMTVMRFWIGDMIGAAIFAPLFLSLIKGGDTDRPLRPTPWINLLQGFSILLALWIIFGGDLSQHPTLYYPLFMPLVWVGAWHGLRGVTVALFATQVVMIIAIEEAHLSAETLTEVQFFLLALAITSLLLGAIASERRRDRTALADAQARLRAIFAVIPEGMLILGAAGRIDQVNPAFERLSGRRASGLIGRDAAALFPEFAGLLQAGGESRLRRSDGTEVPVVLSVGRTEAANGCLRVVSLRDMSGQG